MTFMPDGRLLVTERTVPGKLHLVTQAGADVDISAGLPAGNNGLLDIALDPNFAVNRKIYFSYM